MRKAIITGVGGQDGQFLTDFLFRKDYEVHGFVRVLDSASSRKIQSLYPRIKLYKIDLNSRSLIVDLVKSIRPDEIYNLAAISSVAESNKHPFPTFQVCALGAVNLFEAIKESGLGSHVRVYQASSSEMFGNSNNLEPKNELSVFTPKSFYGVSKVFAHQSAGIYRENYMMYISCGIMFNHESENRDEQFVTRRITSNLAKIQLKKIEKFSLGSLAPRRDWGYAPDYVEAMWLMLQIDEPQDFVISTGVSHSVEDFLKTALRHLNLGGEVSDYVEIDNALTRPNEIDFLVGNSEKAKKLLNWKPKTHFNNLVVKMLENDIRLEELH